MPPSWVAALIEAVEAQPQISTAKIRTGLSSDKVLAAIAPALKALGYDVETGKEKAGKIRRPVLFGEQGKPELEFQVDAVHDELGIIIEVEAGRGARGNATYRDLIRAGLIVNARFLCLMLPIAYRHNQSGREVSVAAYGECSALLHAVYASRRLTLPFEGVLLVGY